MPPKVRIPTVEFRSLLLPPIRVTLRALQSVERLRCAHQAPRPAPRVTQCLTHCRCLHLYKTARAKTLLGQHKLMTFSPYEVAPLTQSQHKVNLVKSEKNATVIAADISLQELYDNHVGPGKMLYLAHDVPKRLAENLDVLQTEKTVETCRNFAIVEPYACIKKGSKQIILRPTNGHQIGELKCIMIRLSSPAAYFKISMDRAYQFVDAGSPVEFRIRLRGSTNKEEKRFAGPMDNWQWMHDHWPHLRPDFILKSMPEGSSFLIDPVSDGYIVQFVISMKARVMPKLDLNDRLWKVKEGVTKSTKSGRQSQLPRFMREELAEQGSKAYSPHSGLPKAQALAGYTKDKSVAKWGFEEGDAPPRAMLFTAKSLAKRRKQTLIPKGAVYQPGNPYEPVPEADPAALEARRRAIHEWQTDVKRLNQMLPPLDPTSSAWDQTRQESATQAEYGERQDEQADAAVEEAKQADAKGLDSHREGYDFEQRKMKRDPRSRPWIGRGKR
ncbi:hypothetical protein J1614_000127 [Plenodomus biglobosus]|nr:hypothetical protein J1614_000127 [Plenodomus biglobosus]